MLVLVYIKRLPLHNGYRAQGGYLGGALTSTIFDFSQPPLHMITYHKVTKNYIFVYETKSITLTFTSSLRYFSGGLTIKSWLNKARFDTQS